MGKRRDTGEMDRAIARAMGYSLLAFALAYPEQSRFDELRELAEAAEPVLGGTVLGGLAASLRASTREQLEPAYVQLCTFTSSPDCPTFETAYYGGDPQQQTARMADIAGFYRAFGVDTGSGGRPDDVCVELEFMAYLCRKEIYARESLGAPRVAQVTRAQRLFLQEHLGTWGPALGRRITSRAEHDFYRRAGVGLAEWVTDDCQRLGAKPLEVSGEPIVEPSLPMSHGPEFSGPANTVFAFDDIPVV